MQNATPLQAERLTGVEEAAVLFSANLVQAAIDELEDCVRRHPAGDPRPWLMLLDMYAATDRRSAFELAADRYAQAFPAARVPARGGANPVAMANTIALKGVLTKPDNLGGVYESARERKILAIDMGEVERIAYSYAGEFAMALKALNAAGKRVILVNIAEVHAVLLELFELHKCVVLMRRKGRIADTQLLAA